MIKTFIKQIAVYGAGDLVFRLVNFAVFPLYANLFSLEEFGIITLIMTLTGLFSILINSGITSAVSRYYWDENMTQEERVKVISTGFMMITALSIAVTGLVIFSFYRLDEQLQSITGIHFAWFAVGVASNIPAQIAQYTQDTLRLHFAPVKFIFIGACKNLLGVAISLYFVIFLKWGITGYFLGILLGPLIACPLGIALIRKELRPVWDFKLAKKISLLGYPYIFAGLAFWIFSSLDRWMINFLSTSTEVGIYAAAFKLAMVINFLEMTFNRAWGPFAMKLFSEDKDYRSIYSAVFGVWSLILCLSGGFVALFSYEFFYVFTPMEYHAAASVAALAVVGAAIDGVTSVTVIGITIEKRTTLIARGAWLSAIANIGMNLIWVPQLGARGAAFATLISYLLLTGLYLYWTQKLHPIPLQWSTLIFPLSVLLSIAGGSFLFRQKSCSLEIVLIKLSLLAAVAILGGLLNWKKYPQLALRTNFSNSFRIKPFDG